MADPLNEQLIDQLREQLHAGRKISAIKLYRQHTGASLVAAKNYVEGLAAGRDLGTDDLPGQLPGTQLDEVLDAIEAGKKLEAVKLYKESSGVSLMEAKEFIENLMRELEIDREGSAPRGTGCGAVILFAIVLASSLLLKSLYSS